MQKKQKNTWILTLTLALYVLPIYIDLWINGWMRVFSYFAADTFYYLTVARNFGRISIFSFDGEHITNGFHPLWQVMTGYLYRLVDGLKLSEPGVLVAVLTLSVFLIALAIFLLGRAFINFFGQLSAFFYCCQSVYALLIWLIFCPGWLQSRHVFIVCAECAGGSCGRSGMRIVCQQNIHPQLGGNQPNRCNRRLPVYRPAKGSEQFG